jgi:hypothetical protein
MTPLVHVGCAHCRYWDPAGNLCAAGFSSSGPAEYACRICLKFYPLHPV